MPDCAQDLRSAIEDAKGNEVFAVCLLDEDGMIYELEVVARGKRDSVPALKPHMEGKDVLVHNHPSGLLEPSQADMGIAMRMGDQGMGFYIVDNLVSEVYVVAEAAGPRHREELDANALSELLEQGGGMALRLSGYERRESQLAFLKSVARAFNKDAILAAEAGTGVGKSFAYLIPAMDWAVRNKERVVVSTATINLQEQLIDKDIPAVNAILERPAKACLVKGRANYLCQSRLREALEEEGLFGLAEDAPLRLLAVWAEQSPSGSRSDLPFPPEEGLWSRVCSEADYCLNLKCPNRQSCFVLAMKRQASESSVLVVNHHLLFSDLQARLAGAGYENTAVLPPFSRLVLDEAHNIESDATSYFSSELNRFSVFKQLGRLLRERRTQRFGAIPRLQASGKLALGLFAQLPSAISAVREAMAMADAEAQEILGDEFNLRMGHQDGLDPQRILPPLAELEKRIQILLQGLQELLDAAEEELSEEAAFYEIKAIARRLSQAANVCVLFRDYAKNPDQVYWLSKERTLGKDYYASFNVTPINISGMMREAVYQPYPSVVCTSATLTVNGGFEFWKSRVGLLDYHDRECIEGIYPSPFPYKTNVLLCVPSDAPLPDQGDFQGYVNRSVLELLQRSNGSALVLFTSYESLRSAYDYVKPTLNAQGIACLRQGEDERSRLLSRFKTDTSSVLFATDSFWEGVDAPGDTLRLVIIAKLPFKVPTDPVQKARAEAIEAAGGNSFMDMSLPVAVMRLKQGFGRLMRRSDDHGAVVILDSRVLKKRYGELFVSSLPETRRCFKGFDGVLDAIEAFLYPAG